MKKRLTAISLSLALLLALLPMSALAAEEKPYTVISEEYGVSYTMDGYLRTEKHVYPLLEMDDYTETNTVVGLTIYVVKDGSQVHIEALPGVDYCVDKWEWEYVDAEEAQKRMNRGWPYPFGGGQAYGWDAEKQTFTIGGLGGFPPLYQPETWEVEPYTAYSGGNDGIDTRTFFNDCYILSESDYNKLVPIDPAAWTEVIPAKYDYAFSFSDGLAEVCLDGKWGYIDTTGNEVISCKYDIIGDFYDGLAAVELNGKCGFIDKTGKEVIPCTYDDVGYWGFSEGLAAVKRDGKWGYIDTAGREVIPCTLEYDMVDNFNDGLASTEVLIGGWDDGEHVYPEYKYGFIDKTGKEVIPPKYDSIWDFSDGRAEVCLDDKWGYIDTTGKEVIPCKYDTTGNFSDGLAAVELDEKWGYIDKNGNQVIPGQYDWAWAFDQGKAEVRQGEEYYYIDKTGQRVEAPPWQDPETELTPTGSTPAQLYGKWGYVTLKAATPTVAYPSTQTVDVDGKQIEFQCYALKDANGYDTNYIKLRDLADILNGSAAQFEVNWNGNVTITTGQSYTPNGSEQKTPFSGQRAYKTVTDQTLVDGKAVDLAAFTLNDDNGGGYTYYKLRDLGEALGIKVDWTAERGIFIVTK